MAFENIVTTYGYPALVIGTVLEGEIILFAGGFEAHTGYLKLPWVMAAAFLGSLAGDQIYFFFGRRKGKAFVQKRPHWKKKVEKVSKLVDRHTTLFVVGFRFMSGLRTVTPFALGLTKISARRFILLNAIGALLWSVVGSLIGYGLGYAAQAANIDVKKDEHWIILGMLCIGALVYIVTFFHKRRSVK